MIISEQSYKIILLTSHFCFNNTKNRTHQNSNLFKCYQNTYISQNTVIYMKQIFIAGAGLSSASLIEYLLNQSEKNNWKVMVGDYDISVAQQRIGSHKTDKPFLLTSSIRNNATTLLDKPILLFLCHPVCMYYLLKIALFKEWTW